jgi:D-tyrosyl-tRNA(Tyr) deacylase
MSDRGAMGQDVDMRALVQRVTEARVRVDDRVVGEIGPGLCVFLGVSRDDTADEAARVADKLWGLRLFADADGVMNLSVAETTGEILVVSQFTLYGDTRKGRRPSWLQAAPPEQAEPLVTAVIDRLGDLGATVATGRFRADMQVALVNDGPATVIVEV